MNKQSFSGAFRQVQEWLCKGWRRVTGHSPLSHPAGHGGLVGSSRQRSVQAYKEFARISARQMQDFLRRNRDWHH